MKRLTVGIVFADSMEYAPFLNTVKNLNGFNCKESIRFGNESAEGIISDGENEIEVVAVKCGIGKSNAASATAFLIGSDKADVILNAGLSGAVQKLRREDIVAGTSYIECDFDLTAVGNPLGVKAGGQKYLYSADSKLLSLLCDKYKKAALGTGDLFLADKVKKDLYKDTFNIEAFDMETGAIASVCDKCNIPFLSLRKISDDADDASVSDYREMNQRQEVALSEILIELLQDMLKEKSFFA